MKYIETARKVRRFAGRPRRRWPWVLLAILVNLVMIVAIVLMAEGRFAELEHRIEMDVWRGELATARSEMGEEAAELRSDVTELRDEVAKLRREADVEAELRDGLASLGERVDRIEGMVVALWRSPPTNGARLGVTS